MLDTLITSKTRLRLLFTLFVDPNNEGYLRGFANDFGDSTNAIRKELNRLYEAQYLVKFDKGNRVYYKANTQHVLYQDLQRLLITVQNNEGTKSNQL
ncbi:MAG: hypothetical protein BM564_12945 [Bacteroidetes bacterium MedPE-SWsnd-G2]|nr:MAG: hypothetical protein BM564_12945 [Bacteroidetes bacterium MedPE-SWsnd-G2]